MLKPDPNRDKYGNQLIVDAADSRSPIDRLDYTLTQMARNLQDALQSGDPDRSPILGELYRVRIEVEPLIETGGPY